MQTLGRNIPLHAAIPAVIYTDSDTVRLSFTITGIETTDDGNTIQLNLTISEVESSQLVDASAVQMGLLPNGSDLIAAGDIATAYLKFTPNTHDCVVTIVPDYEAILDRKWTASGDRKWEVADFARKWEAVIGESPVTC